MLDFIPEEEETKMSEKCRGTWDTVLLVFDGSGKQERGSMSIEPDVNPGHIKGDHFDEGNPTSKKLKGDCKNGKINFRRLHKDGGVIVHTGDVVSNVLMKGRFKIVAGSSIEAPPGDESGEGDKDKDKDKDKEVGDTGTWTGTRDGGAPGDKDKKPRQDEVGGYGAQQQQSQS